MPVNNYIIKVNNLKKRYKEKPAVDGVSFSIKKGTCFGLLGPNGAGKTTIVEMMENILEPDSGQILYKNNIKEKSFQEEIGIQFQHTELLNYLTVYETIKTFSAFYKNPLSVEEIMSLCMLENISRQYNNKISGGQKQRLLLGLALLNDPDLIFLDEPSTGLDPQARQHVWDIIRKMKTREKTIVLTTHYMEEAQSLCDDIIILDNGKIIAQGSPLNLIEKYCRGLNQDQQNLEAVFLNLTGHCLRE